ncbi:hypothetical protein LCGC14_0691330 [marine sediment metagenome]|uniref:Uncharacterized protein n=1 Tax=marine sediment metagenome TaxID=412755 RepID=A0A0F9QKC2_9ZZZZ
MIDYYERLRRFRSNIPDLHNGSYRRVWGKAVTKKSMRAAVNAKCQDCMCWQSAEIRQCDIITCPLWQYRPYQGKDEKERCKAVLGIAGQIYTDSTRSFADTPAEAMSGAGNSLV